MGWNKFRQLVPLLTNKDIPLTVRGRLYSSCVQSSMLHGSETWPIRKENEVLFQQTEMRMVRDNPGELVPEGTFCRLLNFLMQNEDNTGRHTNNPDGLPPHPD